MTAPKDSLISQDSNAVSVESTALFCHCGDAAVIAVQMTNIQSTNWIPQCERCYQHHLECAQEVNEHEMDRFGGAYGLVTWDERNLEGATQNEDGYLSWQNIAIVKPDKL